MINLPRVPRSPWYRFAASSLIFTMAALSNPWVSTPFAPAPLFAAPAGEAGSEGKVKLGVANLAVLFFLHPAMRNYDLGNNRFLRPDPELKGLSDEEKAKIRDTRLQEIASKAKTEWEKLAPQRKRLAEVVTAIDENVAELNKQLSVENRRLTGILNAASGDAAEKAKEEYRTRAAAIEKPFWQKQSELQADKDKLEKEIAKRAFGRTEDEELAFLSQDEMEQIKSQILSEVKKAVNEAAAKQGCVLVLNNSFLMNDFRPEKKSYAPVDFVREGDSTFLHAPENATEGQTQRGHYKDVKRNRDEYQKYYQAEYGNLWKYDRLFSDFIGGTIQLPEEPAVELVPLTAEACQAMVKKYALGEDELTAIFQFLKDK